MKGQNPKKYGKPPYRIALIHGGPGGAGEMAPVARELAPRFGVLEPLQTAATLDGQVDELFAQLKAAASLPAILVGFSWGAWLSFITAARHPETVSKLILVGSGPFHAEYAGLIEQTRISRLTAAEKQELELLRADMAGPDAEKAKAAFARFGEICSRADSFEAVKSQPDEIDFRPDVFTGVWKDAAEMRRSGKLLKLGGSIRCPVTAIHGDYDPHPAEGVSAPLAAVLDRFTFILLEKCGHKPWIERHAREAFFRNLAEEITEAL